MTYLSAEERIFQETELQNRITREAERLHLTQTLCALALAAEGHKDQYRKGPSRLPYITHPLTVANHALSLGYRDDSLLAVCLLHDICEDCEILPESLPVSPEAREAVHLLTFFSKPSETRSQAKARYFAGLHGSDRVHRLAILTKLMDRCHNLSSMAFGFSTAKMRDYIAETRHYLLPLLEEAKTVFPSDREQLFLLQYQLKALMNTAGILLEKRETVIVCYEAAVD